MAHADLHRAVAVDREILRQSSGDARTLDPIVRVDGLPGTLQPFVAHRAYQGPQGYYVEHFRLIDQRGIERYRSPRRKLLLEGEMFENEIVGEISDVRIEDGREHTMLCYIDGVEVGQVPVFVQTLEGGDPRTAAEATLAQALKKSTILWVTVPQPKRRGRRDQSPEAISRPVWFVADGTTIYVLSGPTEQELPGITEADEVMVTARAKDARSLVTEIPASVEIVPQDDPRYETFERSAVTRRLNLPDGEGAAQRWRENCTLLALTPRLREPEDERADGPAPAQAPAAASQGAAAPAAGDEGEPQPAGKGDEQPHVEAQIDQEVYDRLISEGHPERTARAKAKAAYVKAERKRLREQADA